MPLLRPATSLRSRAAMATAAMAITLLVAGCASWSGAAPTTDEDTAVVLPAGEGTTEYPLTLESPYGETVLEERPARIAVITASTVDTDAILALGVIPVMAPSTVDRNPWLDVDDVERIGDRWESEASAEVSAETVAASRPDLIVSLYSYETVDQGYFDQLNSIAPVLYGAAGELSWQDITRAVGEPLDLAAEAETVIADAETAVAEARAQHPEFEGKTAAHVIVYEEEYGATYASAPGTDSATLFAELGFTEPTQAAQFPDDGTISPELVGLIDADFLLLSTFGSSSNYFIDDSLVQSVPAVAQGNYAVSEADPDTEVNYFAWGLNVQSALSVPWLIDQLVAFGSEALS